MARRRNRPSIGRKVEIRRIEKLEARQVCFSKRRVGMFKKANELAILCGVELAVVTFSPARKAFSFGHPSIEAVMERFAPTGLGAGVGGGGGAAGDDNGQLAQRYAELRAMIDAEKARKERVDAAMAKEVAVAAHPVVAMLQADLRDLGEKELVAYDAAVADMQAAMAAPAPRLLQDALNHGRVMAARARYHVIPPRQQFLLAGNGAARFVGQFDAGSSSSANNNGAGMDMQVQHQMMMVMAMPPPGFAASGMQMLTPPPGFAASGMQMLPPPPGFAASGMQMLPPPGSPQACPCCRRRGSAHTEKMSSFLDGCMHGFVHTWTDSLDDG